jgi:hypothetical protein
MNRFIEKIDQVLFPDYVRRFVTFGGATVFLVIAAVGSFAIDKLSKQATPQSPRFPETVHSPKFIALHLVVVGLGFLLIYRTRECSANALIRRYKQYGHRLG